MVADSLRKGGVTNDRGKGVRIAIFDTWPHRLDAAVKDKLQGGNPIGVHSFALTVDLNSKLCDQAPGCNHGITHNLPDHGLFVASIIGDLAPEATISVYRIFGDRSAADIETMAAAMFSAIDEAKRAGEPLILNLSFGFGPPLPLLQQFMADPARPNRDLARWFDEIESVGPCERKNLVDQLEEQGLVSKEEHMFKGPLELLNALFATTGGETKLLVVAASGNDTCRGHKQLGPRVPAAMERVVAASAFAPSHGGHWIPASYSNDDDFFADNDGIGAMGGEIHWLTRDTRTDCGIYGPYVSPTYPPSRDGLVTPNTTGSALWAGTSFAAPIVAAFAACIWSENTAMKAGKVRERVLTRGDGNHREVLKFRQERRD